MATINLGRVKPVFRGAYSGATAYVVDDIVTYSNETYICILASTGNLPTDTTYWTKLAAKGTDGTDLTTTLTTQGDIVVRGASGLERLAIGSSGQALKVNSGATGYEFGTAGGIVQVKKVLVPDVYGITVNNTSGWSDVPAFDLNFTPTSASNAILLLGMINFGRFTASQDRMRLTLFRDSTLITAGTSPGNRLQTFAGNYVVSDTGEISNSNLTWWDTPNTTSQVTYKIKMTTNTTSTTTGYINRSQSDADNTGTPRSVSSLVALEINNGVL